METLDKEELIITFMEDNPEEPCQQLDGCSKVAVWTVKWAHMEVPPCQWNHRKNYCDFHLRSFLDSQNAIGVAAICKYGHNLEIDYFKRIRN